MLLIFAADQTRSALVMRVGILYSTEVKLSFSAIHAHLEKFRTQHCKQLSFAKPFAMLAAQSEVVSRPNGAPIVLELFLLIVRQHY